MDYKVITSSSPEGLTTKVSEMLSQGWEPVGSHQVLTIKEQNRYRGDQHIDTLYQLEYSQTIIKKSES